MMAIMQLILLFCSVLYIDVVSSIPNRTVSSSDGFDLESSPLKNLHRRRGRIFGGYAEFKFPDVPIYKSNGFKSLLHLVDSIDDKRTKQKHRRPFQKDVATDPAKRKDHPFEGSTTQPIKERKNPSQLNKEHIPTGLHTQDDMRETKDRDTKQDNDQLPFAAKDHHLQKKLKDQRSFTEKEHPKDRETLVTGYDQKLNKVLTSKDDINLDVESGFKDQDKIAPFRDQPKVDFISSPMETATHTLPQNGSLLMSSKKVKRNDLLDITRMSRLWVGVGVGACSCLVIVIVMSLIYFLLRSRRGRNCKLNELSLDTSNDDKPIYIKLSQLHRPKRSPNYIVTVLDESHFSINSDDTSEEELFDLSAIQHMSPSKAAIKNNLSSAHNVTSTPKKNNCASLKVRDVRE